MREPQPGSSWQNNSCTIFGSSIPRVISMMFGRVRSRPPQPSTSIVACAKGRSLFASAWSAKLRHAPSATFVSTFTIAARRAKQKHWPQHRLQCKGFAVAIEEHLCIAVPDYSCFWQYQHAFSKQANLASDMPVMVMSRERFDDMFGAKAATRTILHLALTGKPLLCIASAFAVSR